MEIFQKTGFHQTSVIYAARPLSLEIRCEKCWDIVLNQNRLKFPIFFQIWATGPQILCSCMLQYCYVTQFAVLENIKTYEIHSLRKVKWVLCIFLKWMCWWSGFLSNLICKPFPMETQYKLPPPTFDSI